MKKKITTKVFKKVGLALLLIPLGFLTLFMMGEVLAGNFFGISHLIQAIPLLGLLLLAFKKPIISGLLLISGSLFFGLSYLLKAPFNFQTIFLVEVFLFIPPFISGMFLVLSSKRN